MATINKDISAYRRLDGSIEVLDEVSVDEYRTEQYPDDYHWICYVHSAMTLGELLKHFSITEVHEVIRQYLGE